MWMLLPRTGSPRWPVRAMDYVRRSNPVVELEGDREIALFVAGERPQDYGDGYK